MGESFLAATDESFEVFSAFFALLFFGLPPPSSAPASFGNNAQRAASATGPPRPAARHRNKCLLAIFRKFTSAKKCHEGASVLGVGPPPRALKLPQRPPPPRHPGAGAEKYA